MRAYLLGLVFIGGCHAASPDAALSPDLISPKDPRFAVYELSNSAGDRTFKSTDGTILGSFLASDARYCRYARFDADSQMILACREPQGWKIEAMDAFPIGKNGPTSFGGTVMPALVDALKVLNPEAEFLDEQAVVEAAANDWQQPGAD